MKNMVSVLSLVLVLMLPGVLYGQGALRGTVTDSLAKSPLIGVNVFLVGSGLGCATDVDGQYRINGIPLGKHTLRVSSIGYAAREVQVTISSSTPIQLNFELSPTVIQGKEVVITAQMRGQVAAMNNQISSNTMVSVVAADRIRELPDANAAEAIGRLPGISLKRNGGEANQVVIRGMEPKLNLTTVNGIKIPSTSTTNRSVDLSMVSSESLEGIEVFKAPTPDMDADAVGGVVNLKIKKAPDEEKIQLKLTPGYNQLANSFGDFKVSGEYSNRFFGDAIGIVTTANYERVNRSSESSKGSYKVGGYTDSTKTQVDILGSSTSIGNTIEMRKRGGAGLTLDYLFDQGRIWLTSLYNITSRDPFSTTKKFLPNDGDRIEYFVQDQKIDLSGFSNSLNGEFTIWNMKMDWALSSYRIVNDNSYDFQMTLWQGSPFDKSILVPKDAATYYPAAKDNLSQIYLHNNYDYPNKMVQTDNTAQYNLKIPWQFGNFLAGSLKGGLKYSESNRDNTAKGNGQQSYYLVAFVPKSQAYYNKKLLINANGFITSENFVVSPTASANIVNNKYKLFPQFGRDIMTDWNIQQRDSNYSFDRNTLADSYSLQETMSAGYLMAEIKLGGFLTIIGGARYEHENNWYQSVWTSAYEQYGRQGLMRDTTTSRVTDHWFPHLHLKIQVLEGLDLRASANSAISRPDFYWISPWVRYDQQNGKIASGNPSLKETKINNYNVTASVYDNVIGLFSVSGFYKDLRNIFYQKVTSAFKPEDYIAVGLPSTKTEPLVWTTYENADRAQVRGVEVEWQTQLAYFPGMPDILKGVVFNANYSRVWSSTYYPNYVLITENRGTPRAPILYRYLVDDGHEGTMPGQANGIINLALGYDVGGFSTRISYAHYGESINNVGQQPSGVEDTWNQGFTRWDATLKYRFTKWLNLNINLVNITNQPDEAYFGSSAYQTNNAYYGMTGSASIEVTF
ncbi:MAG: TonB-dependent receptor [Ignavibacteria bacterium]|nr:TonB-dependent receptor [Ignavibacteria bacterium]